MQKRRVKYIIFMIDHRHLDSPSNLDHQLAWKFLESRYYCSMNRWPSGKKKKRAYLVLIYIVSDYPMAVGIWANKYDMWEGGARNIKVISP